MSGELITAGPGINYQAQLRDWLAGDGTEWRLRSLRGPGSVQSSGPRSKRDLTDGASAGFDSRQPLDILMVFLGEYGSPGLAEEALAVAEEAWEPSGDEDEELHLLIPSRGHLYWTGRPMELDATRLLLRPDTKGVIQIECRFEATNPVANEYVGGS